MSPLWRILSLYVLKMALVGVGAYVAIVLGLYAIFLFQKPIPIVEIAAVVIPDAIPILGLLGLWSFVVCVQIIWATRKSKPDR